MNFWMIWGPPVNSAGCSGRLAWCFGVVLLACFSAHAQEDSPCDPGNQYKKQSIVLYTSNGIKTARVDGQVALLRIAEGWRDFEREKNARCVEYDYDFDSDSFDCKRRLEYSESRCFEYRHHSGAGVLGDLFETLNVLNLDNHRVALRKLATSDDDTTCLVFDDSDDSDGNCRQTVGQRRVQLVGRIGNAAVDIIRPLQDSAREYLERGRRVLLMGHSEGSLISHRAYEELQKERGGFYSEALGAILIATPLSESSSCASDLGCLHFTNEEDVVVNLLRVVRPADPPLPGSVNTELTSIDDIDDDDIDADFFRHRLVKSYWPKGLTSRRVLNQHFIDLFGDSGAVRYPVPTFTTVSLTYVVPNTQDTPSALPRLAVARGLMPFNSMGMLTPSFGTTTISSNRPAGLFSEQPGISISEQADSIVIEGGGLAKGRTGVWSGEVLLEERNGDIVQTVGVGRVAIAVKDDEVDCEDCLEPEMVVVSAGRFRMGDLQGDGDTAASPVHTVDISSFTVGKYEITRAQFEAFVDATNYDAGNTGNTWRDPGFSQTGQHPVVRVSWDDARAYIAWLNGRTGKRYRLLTESEWEYVARAGTETLYHFGNDAASLRGNANCRESVCADGFDHTAPVGSFGANAFGVHDMHGNVWEWVEDCLHENYNGAPTDGSAWLEGDSGDCGVRVLRGGSWGDGGLAGGLRAADRFWLNRNERQHSLGFRLAQDL